MGEQDYARVPSKERDDLDFAFFVVGHDEDLFARLHPYPCYWCERPWGVRLVQVHPIMASVWNIAGRMDEGWTVRVFRMELKMDMILSRNLHQACFLQIR